MPRILPVLVATAATVLSALVMNSGGASARVRYPEGIACHAARHPVGPYTQIAGVYLGGRDVGNHFGNSRDTRFFQGCFITADACAVWLSRMSLSYPLNPVVARCTPVELGRRPVGVPLEWPSPVRWY